MEIDYSPQQSKLASIAVFASYFIIRMRVCAKNSKFASVQWWFKFRVKMQMQKSLKTTAEEKKNIVHVICLNTKSVEAKYATTKIHSYIERHTPHTLCLSTESRAYCKPRTRSHEPKKPWTHIIIYFLFVFSSLLFNFVESAIFSNNKHSRNINKQTKQMFIMFSWLMLGWLWLSISTERPANFESSTCLLYFITF